MRECAYSLTGTCRKRRVAKTITLIRHAQTNANRAHMWQGNLDTGLSDVGIRQLGCLGRRFEGARPEFVISSDLGRAKLTASAVSDTVHPDKAWREFGVGSWEGRTTTEILAQDPDLMEAFLSGEDVAPGGGELMSDFGERIVGAFSDLVAHMGDGDHVHVVTHGGAIWVLLSHILGHSGLATAMTVTSNTAVTVVTVGDGGDPELTVFNDATHLEAPSVQFMPEGKTVTLFRHGQSVGNVAGTWQGRTDGALTAVGEFQAAEAAMHAPSVSAMYTSPLLRARVTAEIIGERLGIAPMPVDGLVELAFGAWEDLTYEQASAQDPELVSRIYEQGIDLPRGGTGETFAEAGERLAETVASLGDTTDGDIAVVSHGAAIRAYIVGILGLEFSERNRISLMRNTAMSSVLYAGGRQMVSSYNVAPHLSL